MSTTGNLATPPLGKTPTIPLTDEQRAAYQDLYDKIEAEIEGTTDVTALEALNPQQGQIDDILTKDAMCRLHADTALFKALLDQINDTNRGLKALQGQIAATASHFATAGSILGAIEKVLTMIPLP